VKVTLRRAPHLLLPEPAAHVPALVRPKAVHRSTARRKLIVVEGDHQAAVHDPELDAAATAMVADLQPDEHVFLGDGCDFPTISRHADHPAEFGADVKTRLESYYGILPRCADELSPGLHGLVVRHG
jgi:hypothetical protein